METQQTQASSYRQIARSTGIFGGSQAINMVIGAVRTKVVALLLGTGGVGLLGLYQSVIEMIQSVTSLGLGFSAVKDISQAVGRNDETSVARTAQTVRRWIGFTAVAGALLTIAFSKEISRLAFHDTAHALPISFLSFAVFAGTLASGLRTILQGLRRIGDMAKASVAGTLLSAVGFIVLFFLFGEDGIIPALLTASLITLAVSVFYVWKVKLPKLRQTWRTSLRDGRKMVVLGIYSVTVGLCGALSMVLVKSHIGARSDMDTVGLFQSAWTLSAWAVTTILTAMSADYYPRLCAVSDDGPLMRKYVAEQVRVGLLLAGAVVVGMLLFSPLVLRLFYSSRFVPAEPMLRWQMAGSLLTALNWPLSFVVLSRGKGWLFCLTEVLWDVLYVALAALLWPLAGLEGVGMAYFAAHVVYTAVLLFIVRKECAYRPEAGNVRLEVMFFALAAAAFLIAAFVQAPAVKYPAAAAVFLLAAALALYEFNRIVPLAECWHKLFPKRHG